MKESLIIIFFKRKEIDQSIINSDLILIYNLRMEHVLCNRGQPNKQLFRAFDNISPLLHMPTISNSFKTVNEWINWFNRFNVS